MNLALYFGVLPVMFSDWRTWVTVGFAIVAIAVLKMIAVPGVKKKKKDKVPRIKAVPQAKPDGEGDGDEAGEDKGFRED